MRQQPITLAELCRYCENAARLVVAGLLECMQPLTSIFESTIYGKRVLPRGRFPFIIVLIQYYIASWVG